jgi:zinc/manganese transport system ATP-binding protein
MNSQNDLDAPESPTGSALLSLEKAAVTIAGNVLWHDVNLKIGAGEFVAVLGSNGTGKSTLIKVILGLIPLSMGTVKIFGDDPGKYNELVGYLPQRRNFDAAVGVRGVDLVRLGLDGNRWGVPLPLFRRWTPRERRNRERVDEVIRLVGAEEYAKRPIGKLSGGEQQRLLIAQALASNPRILLLDEPLDSLDLPNQSAIASLISKICREENVMVIMATHDVNPILNQLDRVVYIARGTVVAGIPKEVINAQTLTRLYGTPIEVLTSSDGRLVVVGEPEAPAFHSDRHQR